MDGWKIIPFLLGFWPIFKVVDSALNQSHTLENQYVDRAWYRFRKCIGDKSATLSKRSIFAWRTNNRCVPVYRCTDTWQFLKWPFLDGETWPFQKLSGLQPGNEKVTCMYTNKQNHQCQGINHCFFRILVSPCTTIYIKEKPNELYYHFRGHLNDTNSKQSTDFQGQITQNFAINAWHPPLKLTVPPENSPNPKRKFHLPTPLIFRGKPAGWLLVDLWKALSWPHSTTWATKKILITFHWILVV